MSVAPLSNSSTVSGATERVVTPNGSVPVPDKTSGASTYSPPLARDVSLSVGGGAASFSGVTGMSTTESRRRNAEQREAALRADEFLAEVEPNRVFCRLCNKWVQLRQDSSFCAYPWVQHRGKCLAR